MNHCNITPSNSKFLLLRYKNSIKKNKTLQSLKRKYSFQYYSKDNNEGNKFFEEIILKINMVNQIKLNYIIFIIEIGQKIVF